MPWLYLFIMFVCQSSFAQVDQSQKEQLEQQRESQRKLDAISDDKRKANEKSAILPTFQFTDTGAQLDVDHSSFGYSQIIENDNSVEGIKFSGAFAAGFYIEKKKERNFRLLAGFELPIDFELPLRQAIPFYAGGVQFGSGFSLYGTIGIDLRLTSWFKGQIGFNIDSTHGSGLLLGVGLTW